MTVTCPACSITHDCSGDTTVERAGPEPDAPWRAECLRCGWSVVEPYPEDADDEADDHACPVCPTCGHRDEAPAPA